MILSFLIKVHGESGPSAVPLLDLTIQQEGESSP